MLASQVLLCWNGQHRRCVFQILDYLLLTHIAKARVKTRRGTNTTPDLVIIARLWVVSILICVQLYLLWFDIHNLLPIIKSCDK